MNAQVEKGHHWLQKLVGEWRWEFEHADEGQAPLKLTGTESVRSLGGLWIVAENTGESPGGPTTSITTIGFDPATGRYPGTWVGSMMNFLFHYDGELDPSEKVLTLHCVGPDFFENTGGTANYQDVIEFVDDNHRRLRGRVQGDDGAWTEFMCTDYYRKQ